MSLFHTHSLFQYPPLHLCAQQLHVLPQCSLYFPSASECNSVRFNGHFPGRPGLACTRMSTFWILLQLRVMEVVLITGVIRRYHQQTSTQFFTGGMPFLLPNQQCQSTEGITSECKSEELCIQ